jgi:ABC-type uncharacterized transport system permease subunit
VILLHFAVAALYAAAAWANWPRTGAHAPALTRAGTWLIPVALTLHAYAVLRAVATPTGLDLSFANALSLVAGLAVLVAWASGLMRTLPGVAAVVLPVAVVCALAPAGGESPHRFPYADETWAALHIGVALLAYALFVVAALQALVLTGLETRLRRGLPADGDGDTPPLLMLESFLFRLVGVGFVLLTITLVSGLLFSEEIFGRPLQFTHKNVFSVAGWLTFAVLLFGRWRYGWRGRRALRWIIAGTVLLVLGYLGSKFVTEVLLRR